MWNFLRVNKIVAVFFLLCGLSSFSQKSLDFGVGTTISVGLQNEWAINLRSQYHQNEKWSYLADYNLFFRRDVTRQNTETYSGIGLVANYKLLSFSEIRIFGGFGYTGNNFDIYKNDPDTSNLYVETGSFNHGAQLKFLGLLPLGERMSLFAEMNIKSFGRRYDTFSFGLMYHIPAN